MHEYRFDIELGSETTDEQAIQTCKRVGHGGNPKTDVKIVSRTPSHQVGFDKFVFTYKAPPAGKR